MAGHKQMLRQQLTCFKAYDVRGTSNINLDANIAYLIGHAAAQRFRAKNIVLVKRFMRYAIKVVVGLKYVTALQVMKCLGVISTNRSKKKVINYSALPDC